ncbi:hypothetical protein HHI36_014678 [Cryptolaemus montrouzieri]|uniref:Uncharacterized protein n=1 Tax=Cryptolaemus montrouzieri TaxID=559131 RepID=A0ABD2N3J6_9CUCU
MKQEMKKQIMEQHKKELETLKAHNAKMMKEMEARSEKKLTEVEEKYEKQNNEMEKKYESNIKDVEDKYRRELKEKDDEIGRLEDIIQKECSRFCPTAGHEIFSSPLNLWLQDPPDCDRLNKFENIYISQVAVKSTVL